MTKDQCGKCGRRAYLNGRCYADRKTGRPISETVYCGWATPPYALPGKLLRKPTKKTAPGKAPGAAVLNTEMGDTR